MSIDLAKPRVFAFEVGKRKFTYTVKPITKAMWLKYFGGIIHIEETTKDGASSSYDSTGARLELLESALIDATGYTKPGESITAVEGWQAKLPLAHRRAISDLLADVQAVIVDVDDEDAYPALGFETITLKSAWTASEEGKMQELTGLRHVFRSPTADHQKRYSRARSRSIVVGGSRTGQTRYLGCQDVLIEIYDELIESVEGYVLDGEAKLDRTNTRDYMDSYHKVAAATALFTPVEVDAA